MGKTFDTILLATLFMLGCSPVTGHAAERTVLKEEQVRQVVSDFLRQRVGQAGVELRLKRLGYSDELPLPPGTVSFELLAPREWEGWGRASLALIVRVDERVAGNIPLNVEVEALADMVVAGRPLQRGELVTNEDVSLQKRDLATVQGRVCRTLDEVLGKQVKSGIRANAPLRGDYLERPPLVRSGQMVSIIAENAAFRVTVSGRAKGNGAAGDTVAVQNLNAQKDITAVVVDANTVRVGF